MTRDDPTYRGHDLGVAPGHTVVRQVDREGAVVPMTRRTAKAIATAMFGASTKLGIDHSVPTPAQHVAMRAHLDRLTQYHVGQRSASDEHQIAWLRAALRRARYQVLREGVTERGARVQQVIGRGQTWEEALMDASDRLARGVTS
jgi:hypothetical protein